SPNNPLRRVNKQVKYFKHGTLKTRILCFHEGKKLGANTDNMQIVEGQAFKAYTMYYDSTRITHIYTLITISIFA
ncbi:hypothetical protein K469DRAFT_574867, partial [Zopfia rhizophila CBS 207.26]